MRRGEVEYWTTVSAMPGAAIAARPPPDIANMQIIHAVSTTADDAVETGKPVLATSHELP